MYGGISKYLACHHPYRRNKRFHGETQYRAKPPIVSEVDVIRYAAWRQSYLDLSGKEDGKHNPVHTRGVKRLSALVELQYWQVT